MKNTSITFNLQGAHTSRIGQAVIINLNSTAPYQTMKEEAAEYFQTEEFKLNKIGEVYSSEAAQPGYEDKYEIYESYVDSGSDDYAYFAINIGSREL